MKIYCMCHEKNNKPDSQVFGARNLYGPYDIETDFRVVVLQQPMKVKKVGVKQVLTYKPLINDWSRAQVVEKKDIVKEHYPYVDMYECPNCGAKICVES